MTIQKKVRFFVIFFLLLYVCWLLLYDFWIAPQTALDGFLIEKVGRSSAWLLTLFGWEGFYHVGYHTVYLGEKACVSVGAPCNGLEIFAVFSIFIIALPMSHLHKIWYIPLGILLIFCLNVLRVAALTLNAYYFPENIDFNHHYLFSFVVYLFVFFLWYIWVTYFLSFRKDT